MKPGLKIVAVALVAGFSVSACTTLIALRENPQGEFRSPTGIVWDSLAPLSAAAFVEASILAAVVLVAWKLMRRA